MTDQCISIVRALQDCAPGAKEIRIKLGLCEVLAQLAEEAAELSQAALKLRRCLDGKNPTPVTLPEAEEQLQEEFADVLLCLAGCIGVDAPLVAQTIRAKAARWCERLEDKDD